MRLSCSFALLLILSSPLGSRAQVAAEPLPADAGATATLSVTTRLVVVPAVVRDKHGALMNTLTKDNFALKIDGKPQALRYFDHDSDVPLTLGLLVDTSMSQRPILDDERAGSNEFLNKMLSPADAAFVMQFDIKVTLWQGVTAERPPLEDALKKVDCPHPAVPHTTYVDSTTSSDGDKPSRRELAQDRRAQAQDDREARRAAFHAVIGTKLFDAVVQSSNDITGKVKGRRALILLTDGGDYGSVDTLSDAIEAAQRADTVVYAIYYVADNFGPFGGLFAPGGGHKGRDILEHLCGETGGKVFEVNSKQSVAQIYAKIAEELRGQYRLGFTPAATAAGYHHVQLAIIGAEAKTKHVLQTRDGFYSSASQ